MKNFNKFLRFCVLAIVLFSLTIFPSSCGAKKKLIQKTQFSTEIATVERVKEKTETESKTDVSTSERSKETAISKDENFEGEIADHTKPATITTEEKDGKKIKTYTNFKNVKTGSQNSESEKNKTFGQNLSKTDKSKTAKKSEASGSEKASGSEEIIKKDKPGKIPWPWIILIIIIYLVYSYFKGSFLPWKWFNTSK